MNIDGLRLELADARVRIATLEAQVMRLVEIVSSEAALRAMRQEVRRERAIDGRYTLIRALVAHFEPGHIEALARRVELVYGREVACPKDAERIVEQLRTCYGKGGPSRRTIRRALTGLPNGRGNFGGAASWAHLNNERFAP